MNPRLLPTAGVCLAALATSASAQFNDKWAAFEKDPSLLSVGGPLADVNHEVDVDWGDLDGDGWTDVVVVRKEPILEIGPRRNVLLMNISGVLTDLTNTLAVGSDIPGGQGFRDLTPDRDVVLVDVDNDGLLDCVTACDQTAGLPKFRSHPRVYVNLGSSGGSWQGLRHEDARFPQLLHNVSGIPLDPYFNAVDAGDVDLDGFADLYFGDQDQLGTGGFQSDAIDTEDRLMINDGLGSFVDQSTVAMTSAMLSSRFCNSVEVGDFNLDGKNDIIKQTSLAAPVQVTMRVNDALGAGSPGIFTDLDPAYTGSPYFIQTGDMNQDGRLDLLVSDNGLDRYILNEGTLGSGLVDWGAPQTFEFLAGADDGFGANSLVADLDGDGWQDAIVTDIDPQIETYNRRAHVYHNLGGTVGGDVDFREERASTDDSDWVGAYGITLSDLETSHDVAVFDVDLDGRNDMLLFRVDSNEAFRGIDPPVCQTNLGFADGTFGDGTTVLEVCGGDLSSGNDATLRLFNAAPSAAAGILVSASALPVYSPVLDATLVAIPPIVTVPVFTDASGEVSVPIAGGSGPATFVVQALVANGGPTLADVSNAIEVTLLP
ncbi:MAG: VCBS repeat-containing protein [Planctomycetota bacterium]